MNILYGLGFNYTKDESKQMNKYISYQYESKDSWYSCITVKYNRFKAKSIVRKSLYNYNKFNSNIHAPDERDLKYESQKLIKL